MGVVPVKEAPESLDQTREPATRLQASERLRALRGSVLVAKYCHVGHKQTLSFQQWALVLFV